MNQQKEITITHGELIAIKKAIYFLKFECSDTDSLLYAGSGYVNSFLLKLIQADPMFNPEATPLGKSGVKYRSDIIEKILKSEGAEISEESRAVTDEEIAPYLYPFSVK